MQLFITIDPPHHWTTADPGTGAVIASGVAESLAEISIDQKIDQLILIANGSSVASHKVIVPGKSRKKAASAIPYILEEELTNDLEDLHFALQSWNPSAESDVLVVEDALVQQWQDQFSQAGLQADEIVPDYLLLPRHPAADVTLARMAHGRYAIRSGEHSGAIVDENLLELWWELEATGKTIAVNDEDIVKQRLELDFENIHFWDIGSTVTEWLGQGGYNRTEPCLLQGKYNNREESRARYDYKLAVNLTLAGIIIYVGALLANQAWLGYKTGELMDRAASLYATAFPETGGQSIQDPVFEMRKSISALKSGNYQSGNFLPVYQVLAAELNRSNATTLTNLVFEDNVLKAQVLVPDFAALDALFLKLATTTQGYARVITKDAVAQDNSVQGVVEIALEQG